MIKNTVKRLPVNLIIPFLTEVSDNPLYQLQITELQEEIWCTTYIS